MILAQEKIRKLVAQQKLIENYDEKSLTGAGYDLRVGKFYRISGEPFLGIKERKLPQVSEEKTDQIKIAPQEYILIETIEKVHMPKDLIARVLNRSTLFRCGCTLITALVDPGYYGILTIGLKNLSNQTFTLEKGARIGQIVFETIDGETTTYEGRYQGGKIV
jgi:deoxycytidine triphosphate deaminase